MVVRGATGALDAEVRHQEKVVLGWVDDVGVDDRARWHVAAFAHTVLRIIDENTRVMAFLYYKESDERLVTAFQSGAGAADGSDFLLHDLTELALADTVTVENDALRFPRRCGAVGLIEAHEDVAHHALHVFDRLLARFLDAHFGAVAGRARVQTAHDGGDRVCHAVVLVDVLTWVSHIGPHNNHLNKNTTNFISGNLTRSIDRQNSVESSFDSITW